MGMHFRVFSDPFEITRYFESQMDDMLKSFGNFGFGNDFHSFSGMSVLCKTSYRQSSILFSVVSMINNVL